MRNTKGAPRKTTSRPLSTPALSTVVFRFEGIEVRVDGSSQEDCLRQLEAACKQTEGGE